MKEEDPTIIDVTQKLEEIIDQMPNLSPEFVTLRLRIKGQLREFLSLFYEMQQLLESEKNSDYENMKQGIMENIREMHFNETPNGHYNEIMDFIGETYNTNYKCPESDYHDIPPYTPLKCKCGVEVYANSLNLGTPLFFFRHLMDSHES